MSTAQIIGLVGGTVGALIGLLGAAVGIIGGLVGASIGVYYAFRNTRQARTR